MCIFGEEAVGSMGSDAALAVLSEKPQPLFRYLSSRYM
jgi:glutamate synthase (NADPH/NADH) large chain